MGTTHLSGLDVLGNTNLRGNLTVSGGQSFSGDLALASDKKVKFRDDGLFIQSTTDGKILYSSDGTGADDHIFSGTVTLNDLVAMLSGLIIDSDKSITFRDASQSVSSPSDNRLQVTSPVVDFTGGIEAAGDIAATGYIDAGGDLIGKRLWLDQVGFFHNFEEKPAALADSLMDYFYTGGGTAGTQAIVESGGGIMKLSTGSTAGQSSSLTWAGSMVFSNSKNWVWHAIVKVSSITNMLLELGMYADGNDCLMFRFDSAVDPANIYLVTENNNGGEVVEDTGADIEAGEWIDFKIGMNSDNTFRVSVNEETVLEVHTGTVRNAAFKPRFFINNKSASQDNQLDVDVHEAWQDRDYV
jgi:hypothetical protein